MRTEYFSIGYGQEHYYNGKRLTIGVLVRITDENPRQKMFDTFGAKWSMQYKTLEDAGYPKYYDKGLFDLNKGEFVNA